MFQQQHSVYQPVSTRNNTPCTNQYVPATHRVQTSMYQQQHTVYQPVCTNNTSCTNQYVPTTTHRIPTSMYQKQHTVYQPVCTSNTPCTHRLALSVIHLCKLSLRNWQRATARMLRGSRPKLNAVTENTIYARQIFITDTWAAEGWPTIYLP